MERPKSGRWFDGRARPKCFISHAYRDAELVGDLLRRLSGEYRTVIWPAKRVSSDRMVSDGIVAAIRRCDCLVYIKSGASAQSPWVAFERDYALRSGKRVYSFDGTDLAPDGSPPLELPVFTVYGGEDRRIVLKVLRFLREARSFDLFVRDEANLEPETWRETVVAAAERMIGAGGFVVWFVPTEWQDARVSRWHVEWLFRRGHSERVIPVLLSDIDLSALSGAWELSDAGCLGDRSINLFRRTRRFGPGRAAMLLSGLPASIDRNRLDDLIVRLYYLIYTTTSSPASIALRGPLV